MLKELDNPRQVADELPRRWFSDKATPILMAPRPFDKDRVAEEFAERAGALEEDIKKLVLEKIIAFPDADNPSP